jgi:hypothetical protein
MGAGSYLRLQAQQLRPLLSQILNHEVPELAARAACSLADEDKYDAILVDEGQGYIPLWWNALRGAHKQGE